jgi:transposase
VCEQCGQEKVCIGHKTSEILEFVPAHFVVIEEKREKLACPSCPNEGVSTAPSDKVMERGRPGPGLLAHIVVDKLQDSMPVERQSDAYKRDGVYLSPSTLGDWSAFVLDVLAPIAGRIRELVFGWFYVQTDDTGIPVQDRHHPQGIRRGHMWVFVGGGIPAFVYTPDWKAKSAAGALKGFEGYLQGDGYAGYAAMTREDDEDVPLIPQERKLGCGMHIRAKFQKAMKAGDARAGIAIAYFKEIYRVEEECKEERLSPEERHKRRQEKSLPTVDKLFKWVHELEQQVVPNSLMYTAVTYARNQETVWRRCFTDGRFEIDNGESERQLRRVALGRKNYLFAGSDKGAERLAVGYTVFAACRMHGVNPVAWATDVITKLQAGWPRSQLDELLPHNWARARAATMSTTDAPTATA